MTVREFINVFDVCEMVFKRVWCYVGGGCDEIIYAKIDDPENDDELDNFYRDIERIEDIEIENIYKHVDNGIIEVRLRKDDISLDFIRNTI